LSCTPRHAFVFAWGDQLYPFADVHFPWRLSGEGSGDGCGIEHVVGFDDVVALQAGELAVNGVA